MTGPEPRAALARRVRDRELTLAPGVFDLISTRVADRMGFPALYMTGYGISASYLGLPDAGLASFTDMLGRAKAIAEAAIARCEDAIQTGRAAEKFDRMCSALGGPDDVVSAFENVLPSADVTQPVFAEGFLQSVDTRLIGNALIELGGGRQAVGQSLDLSVGFSEFAAIGTKLDRHKPLAVVHAANQRDADLAALPRGEDRDAYRRAAFQPCRPGR